METQRVRHTMELHGSFNEQQVWKRIHCALAWFSVVSQQRCDFVAAHRIQAEQRLRRLQRCKVFRLQSIFHSIAIAVLLDQRETVRMASKRDGIITEIEEDYSLDARFVFLLYLVIYYCSLVEPLHFWGSRAWSILKRSNNTTGQE